MLYIGLPCPVCGKKFTEESDIVVCPDCGAPQHRECYLANGKCLFYLRHKDNYEWKPTENNLDDGSQIKGNICANCGSLIPEDADICPECGRIIRSDSYIYSNSNNIAGISDSDWEKYIGSGRAWNYYSRAFRKISNGSRITLNTAAFFFGPLYFMYRKIWNWAIFFSLLFIVFNTPYWLIMLSVSGNPIFSGLNVSALIKLNNCFTVISWIFMLIRGLFANYWYMTNASQKISQYISENKDSSSDSTFKAIGGVSIKAVIFFIAAVTIIYWLILSNCGSNIDALLNFLYG